MCVCVSVCVRADLVSCVGVPDNELPVLRGTDKVSAEPDKEMEGRLSLELYNLF